MKTTAAKWMFVLAAGVSLAGCQTQGPHVQISVQKAKEMNLELSGGVAADGPGSLCVTTPTSIARYEPGPNRMEDLLIDPCQGIRDIAVTSDGVVLALRGRELSACVAGHLVSLHSLPGEGIAVSCDLDFAYVLTTRDQGARLIRIRLTGSDKGFVQTLLATEDRPRALCAVRGGCLLASGGNILKVACLAPAGNNAESEIATALLIAIQEPVTSVAADEDKLIVYFATADATYAWIEGQIVPLFPTGSRLALAGDTLTICRPSQSGSQVIQIPGASRHAAGLLKQLDDSARQARR